MDNLFTYDALVHALAGTAGGQCAMTVFYPLDIIRTHLQVNEKNKNKTALDVIKELSKEDGISALYSGLGPVLLSLGCSNFVYFYTNNALKIFTKALTKKDITTAANLLIASLAGCVNVMTTCPLWVVSTRLKIQAKKQNQGNLHYKGMLDGIKKVASEEGITALWSGCIASLVLVSNPTIQFVTYDTFRKIAMNRAQKQGRKTLSTLEFFVLGAIAKAIATVITYPIQVAQSRLRNSRKNSSKQDIESSGIEKYHSTLDCLIKVFKKDGFLGWYKGLNVKLLQTVLMAAFHFLCYEQVTSIIYKIFGKKK